MIRFLHRAASIACVTLSAILVASCTLFPVEERTPPPLIPRVEIAYNTIVAELGRMEMRSLYLGFIKPVRSEDIILDIPGAVLIENFIDKDDRVEAGDILAIVANEDLVRQLDDMQWALELAQINLSSAVRAFDAARSHYAGLEDRAERERQVAEDQYADAQLLYEHGIISLAELRQAENLYLDTIFQIEQNLAQARASTYNDDAVRRERINLAIAERNFHEVQDKIDSFVVQAPFGGVVTFALAVAIGETWDTSTPLFTIADDSRLYVAVFLSDRDINFGHPLSTGTQVELSVAITGENIDFYGTVIDMTTEDKAAATIHSDNVVIDVRDMPEQITVGAPSITVRLLQVSNVNAIVIPVNALNFAGEYTYVRVVADGVSRERAVETGMMSATEVEILSGLEPGDVVVVR